MGTQEVLFWSVPVADPPAVNTRSPIPQLGAMALATKLIRLFKIDQFAAGRVEHISIVCIVTIDAPPVLFVVFEYDVIMEFFQRSSIWVGFHIGMTLCAGKHILTEGRRGELDNHLVFTGVFLSLIF